MSTLKQRFLLVSDMHLTTEETAAELKKSYPQAKTSAAAGNAFGKTQRQKAEKVYQDICRENQRQKLDAVFVLGDLSIDDAPFRNLPWNFCRKFKELCMDPLPCPSYAIPGNHDSYSNEDWRQIFGCNRQFAVEINDSVFILADTFAQLPATGASGSGYSPLDEVFLRDCLAQYRGKRIFLCAHYLDTNTENNITFSPALRKCIRDNQDLICMFRAHTHVNCVIDMAAPFGSKKIIDIGGYGYDGQLINGKWDFNIFDPQWAWGYQILEIYDDRVRTYHVKPAMHYVATNGDFDMTETIEGETEFILA
jgi:predicted phosphodiesterase